MVTSLEEIISISKDQLARRWSSVGSRQYQRGEVVVWACPQSTAIFVRDLLFYHKNSTSK